MSCILTIRGENLNIDAFLQESRLAPYKTFHRGDPQVQTKPYSKKLQFSGCAIEVSCAGFHQLEDQIRDAISFLELHQDKLRRISEIKEVDEAVLDFGIELRIDEERVVFQFDRFPNRLLKLAGDLGLDIEVSIYPQGTE